MDEATIITREDYYKLAYCYYRNEKYKKAAKKFSSIANSSDRLAQNAYYHLGDCYLQMGEKNKARYAFLTASELKFDKQMSEDALFTYAKLTYELSMYPFNEAVNALNLYIEKYPESNRVDEAYKFLVNVFMTTRNYKDALESIESIRNLTGDIALIYQRVAYFRGLELFNDLQYKEAIDHFDKSLDNAKLNPVIKAQSLYWRAEAYYKLGKYKKAIEGYEAFVLSDGSFELPEYNLAHYNLGYANFKIKQYDKAITWFRMYDQFMENKSSERLGDAYNRIGDCYFISKKYDDAVIYYDESIESELKDVDYALYQKGFALGLLKDYNQKIIVLNQLLNDYSKSSYRAAALFELAKAYLIIEAPEMAISTYQTIIDEYPYSSYVKKAYLGQGLIYYNSGDNDLALEKYKRVVEEFPGNPEIDDALIEIKKIYLDMNNVEGYVDYSNSIGEYTVTKTEEDSLMFITAEKIYLKGDCDQAKGHLNKYIKKFPNGRYILSAHYYKANCNMQNGDEDEALESYQFIISKPKTKYTSNALYNAAKINYKNKNYKAASENYTELEQIADRKNVIKEARIGKMRCNYFIKDYEKAITSAIAVLKTDKIADEIYREAHYDIAKSYYAMDNLQNAMDEFMIISQDCKSREGAEAKFRVAEIYFKQGADTLAENEIIDFNKKMTPYQDWVARSIILLSDIYVSRDDNFQAKAMLQSIITNYSTRGDGIIELAEDKLEDIVTAEEAESMLEESIEDFEVVFEHSDLFDDAEVEKEESNNPDKQSVIESSQEKAVDSKEEEVQPEDKVEKNADEPKEQENTPEIEKGNNNGETE
ncbi:MAG: hypothetical protein C0594_01880 [Marinilabiliales bacterium]|nr:MAG: hypothetical protein C0594_01880 [Marinilabiliales bacterium]